MEPVNQPSSRAYWRVWEQLCTVTLIAQAVPVALKTACLDQLVVNVGIVTSRSQITNDLVRGLDWVIGAAQHNEPDPGCCRPGTSGQSLALPHQRPRKLPRPWLHAAVRR